MARGASVWRAGRYSRCGSPMAQAHLNEFVTPPSDDREHHINEGTFLSAEIGGHFYPRLTLIKSNLDNMCSDVEPWADAPSRDTPRFRSLSQPSLGLFEKKIELIKVVAAVLARFGWGIHHDLFACRTTGPSAPL